MLKNPEQETKTKKDKEKPSLVKDLAFTVFFYLAFTTTAWGARHIPSSSMEPTLEVGDRLFVSKFAYGYNRFSVPFSPGFLPENRLFDDVPARGDIVVFTQPHRGDDDIIKRVIGLPGDTLQVVDGRLMINGALVKRTFIRDVAYTDYNGQKRLAHEFEETLPGGVTHRIYEFTDLGPADNTPLYRVPAGHYFMLGDNRDNSSDSRYLSEMGYVKHEHLIGRADVTTFSLYDCDQGKEIFCPMGIPLGRFLNGLS